MSQVNNPIFEMILDASKQDGISGQAKPSSLVLPVDWHEKHQEGQLAVDVGQTEKDIIIVSTMAGADVDKIEVYVHNDLLTIRGQRQVPVEKHNIQYFYQECYWGKFSRTIVLPVDVKGDLARAEYRQGILTIHIPKRVSDVKIDVRIVDE